MLKAPIVTLTTKANFLNGMRNTADGAVVLGECAFVVKACTVVLVACVVELVKWGSYADGM